MLWDWELIDPHVMRPTIQDHVVVYIEKMDEFRYAVALKLVPDADGHLDTRPNQRLDQDSGSTKYQISRGKTLWNSTHGALVPTTSSGRNLSTFM
jgi:hypothetical protein